MSEKNPIRPLSVNVARKIAAGEVIDRPAAIVRELLDNAVDSGADSISVEIDGGGIEKIRISDNGSGFTKEDLATAAHPHCTSKISDTEDLLNLTTLGFRGEALASIAAVSRLSIMSGNYKMRASITEDHLIEQIPSVQDGKGTIVMSEGLFENFPARRNFLKRPASETMICREVFIEKSLPRPDIAFRLTIDGSIRHDLPSGVSLTERFVRALELKENAKLFAEINSSGKESDGKTEWSFSLVIGDTNIFRNDRKQIFIFVNGRRIQGGKGPTSEFPLIQAIEYGCQGFFPNGTHPVAALFLNVSPKFVDFNIHPAKKEARFKDISAVHHGVSSAVRNYFKSYGIKSDFEREQEIQKDIKRNEKNTLFAAIAEKDLYSNSDFNSFEKYDDFSAVADSSSNNSDFFSSLVNTPADKNVKYTLNATTPTEKKAEQNHFETSYSSKLADFALSDDKIESHENQKNHIRFKSNTTVAEMRFSIPCSTISNRKDSDFIYYGTIFGTFLMVQKQGVFYLIDQHAAHERILFNRLMEGGNEKQELLVPYEIQTESKEEDKYLTTIQATLTTAGFSCENQGNGKWIFTSVPARYKGNQEDLRLAIFEKRVNPEEIMYQIAAMTACKAAVKDGTILGPEAAENLAREALELRDPHCPHGRPCWTTLTKEELFARVRRTR